MAPQAEAPGRFRDVAARRQPARAAPRVSRGAQAGPAADEGKLPGAARRARGGRVRLGPRARPGAEARGPVVRPTRSEEHTSELQSQSNLVWRLLLEKKKHQTRTTKTNISGNHTMHLINDLFLAPILANNALCATSPTTQTYHPVIHIRFVYHKYTPP